ncbi:hypothetical protein LINGRAHAP2_LOCUS29305, partial [Linum grandiflorum]
GKGKGPPATAASASASLPPVEALPALSEADVIELNNNLKPHRPRPIIERPVVTRINMMTVTNLRERSRCWEDGHQRVFQALGYLRR